jgi:glycosyltransferase involved in cell wall biosynthesis
MTSAPNQSPMKILLHIRSLHIGGSERQVVSLAKSMAQLDVQVHVATIVSGGPLENDLADTTNIQLHSVGRPGLIGKLKYLLGLRSLIKENQFDAVYGFLPTPNLALLVARSLRNRPLIAWGVRSSGLDLRQYSGRVKWAIRLEKWLSRFSDQVVTNSQAALEEYRLNGYPYSKLSHVPNAIDTERFKPNANARSSIRNELGIPADVPVIGLFARLHPMKDHLTFLRAAKILSEHVPNARFICAGGTSAEYANYESRIKANATDLGLDEQVIWLGPRNDPEKLMAACDLTTLTSDSGEGFPNSVAESMACGIPCVVTDIGDSAAIVQDSDAVVPPATPDQLADAWRSVLSRPASERDRVALEARESIISRYSTIAIAQETLNSLSR